MNAFTEHWLKFCFILTDAKSELTSAPARAPVKDALKSGGHDAGLLTAKHPGVKRAQGQPKSRKPSGTGTKRSKLAADSAMSSDVPTREPSVDTEMLSLAGDAYGDRDGDDALSSVAAPSVGQRSPHKRRMGDAEMEEFLADD